MATSGSAVILVSHDRAFINNVTNRTLEISCGQVIDYKVKYDEYVVLRKERREQQIRAYENQQKEMADIRQFVERFRYKATKAIQVQQRLRQLEKMVLRSDLRAVPEVAVSSKSARRSRSVEDLCAGTGESGRRGKPPSGERGAQAGVQGRPVRTE